MTFKPTVYDEDSLYGGPILKRPAAAGVSPPHSTARSHIAGLSARGWLLVAGASLVLATGSSVVLYQTLNERHKDQVVLALESVPVFLRRTASLTWHSIVSTEVTEDARDTQRTAADDQALHVAPLGLLDDKAVFNVLETYADFVPRKEEMAMAPVAPLRLLDPEWAVTFNGLARD